MDIWLVPFIIVVVIVSWISIASVRKSRRFADGFLNEQDSEIPEAVEAHPFALNPIIWIILIVTFFTGIIIFYYATSFY